MPPSMLVKISTDNANKYFNSYCVFFLQYMTEKIGGVEGTKLDVDFVDMERVSVLYYTILNISHSQLLKCLENRRYLRVGRRTPDENQRVLAAESYS